MVSNGSFMVDRRYTHTMMKPSIHVAWTSEELYKIEILDEISTGYFQMPVVTTLNVDAF